MSEAVITLNRVADLSDRERDALRELSRVVYPPEEWADWPGHHMEWAAPEWCVRVWSADGQLASHVGIVIRDAESEGQSVRVGGIGSVKTHPAARGRGYAGLGIHRANTFFHEQPQLAFAVLVCEPHLLGYYARLGWREFAGQLLVTQHGAAAEFTFNHVMVCGVQSAAPSVGTIDLLGPPW